MLTRTFYFFKSPQIDRIKSRDTNLPWTTFSSRASSGAWILVNPCDTIAKDNLNYFIILVMSGCRVQLENIQRKKAWKKKLKKNLFSSFLIKKNMRSWKFLIKTIFRTIQLHFLHTPWYIIELRIHFGIMILYTYV